MKTYLALMGMFGSLSLLSIGGGNTVLPEMHLRAVSGYHWMTNSQFADIFSISQAAPGPSILIVALVGYAAGLGVAGVAGGIAGGLLATVAMVIPAATLMYLITLSWQKAQKSKLRYAVEKGFAPLTVGLDPGHLAGDEQGGRPRLAGLPDHRRGHADLRPHQHQPADRGRRRRAAGLHRLRLTLRTGNSG